MTANIAHYEARVSEQGDQLRAMNRPSSRGGHSESGDTSGLADDAKDVTIPTTKEDLEREEREVQELESKKKALEERVEGMGRDLGGLLR